MADAALAGTPRPSRLDRGMKRKLRRTNNIAAWSANCGAVLRHGHRRRVLSWTSATERGA